jgi:hypothetical protein
MTSHFSVSQILGNSASSACRVRSSSRRTDVCESSIARDLRARLTMSRAEVRVAVDALGGITATAREVGCSLKSICRYVNGERAVPPVLAIELRRRTAPTHECEEAAAE